MTIHITDKTARLVYSKLTSTGGTEFLNSPGGRRLQAKALCHIRKVSGRQAARELLNALSVARCV